MTTEPEGPPGTDRPRRFRPKLRYELIGCGLHGHELLGTQARALRQEDALFAREGGGLRWYRCLRCDSWLPLPPPQQPEREHPPERHEVQLPLRGRPLRDRYVLRLIALDRAVHVLVLAVIVVLILSFAGNEAVLKRDYLRVLNAFQNGTGGAAGVAAFLGQARHYFTIERSRLYELAAVFGAYAALEAAEMVGLWFAKRWAEYLTFTATTALVPFEIHELITAVSAFKVIALIINVAICIYLLLAKRLFGLRGGGKAEEAERQRDSGWAAIERAAPGTEATPA